MSRRSKPLFEDWVELLALLPWWVCVTLAVGFYLALHHVAQLTPKAATQTSELGPFAVQSMIASLAFIGQFVAPRICLVAAIFSYMRRRRRAALVADVVHAKCADALDGMSWRNFERLVGQAYTQQGYRVAETGGGGADGGVDLVLTKGGEKFLVQCKQWKARRVGVDIVRALYGVMAARGATGGFVVTSGRFTEAAQSFAQGRNVQLVDGSLLFAMLQQVQQASPSQAVKHVGAIEQHGPPIHPSAPSCPKCGDAMVQRVARNGIHVGERFWGCTQFPKCRGVRRIQ